MAKKSFRRVPSLNKIELAQAALMIDALDISKGGKQALKQIVRAASNPNAEKLDVIVAGLEPDRKATVERGAQEVKAANADKRRRAAQALIELSEVEWEAMVSEANSGSQ
jgi:hypothetical protein